MPDVVHLDPARTSICPEDWQRLNAASQRSVSTLRLPGCGEYPVTHRSHAYRNTVPTVPGTSRASRLGREMP
jgi:hypothetical protein